MLKFKLNSTQTIFGSFIIAILFGAMLLALPISSNTHEWTDFLTCLFTSTSAMCVTGLVVVDTATHWSMFGQMIILVLIQFGGLGIVFVASLITIFLGQKVNLIQRTTLQEALSVQKVGGIIKLTKFIIKGVILFEVLGAGLLFIKFSNEFNLLTAIWYSVFHSISAFCNAGFDLMGFREEFSSLVSYNSDIIINITIMLLIIIGGLGFTVWDNILSKKTNFRKYSLQSKIVILTTILLIFLPAIYFYFFEFSKLTGISRVLVSLFQSVTARTAGFNTISYNEMSEVGKAISIILMLIGGSPGSTAGGIKTTTFAVLIISTIAMYRRENQAHIFNRRIEVQIVKNAITIFMLYFNLCLLASFVICKLEACTLMEALFETASAIGTVGLTLGITTSLSNISKVLLVILMFIGRVGGLTIIYSILPSLDNESGYISEDIAVS